MDTNLNRKRIFIFLAFAFGIAWAVAVVIYLTGGLVNSPRLAPGITLATVLMATGMMWAPALANILTRLITREGFGSAWLRPNLRRGWPYWLIAWVLPGLLVIVGMVVFYLLFPRFYDPALPLLKAALPNATPSSLWGIVITQTLVGILISPLVNAIATFGEEFGWRAYLLQKLLPRDGSPAGTRRALLLMGVIWGVWHWPVIFMGYEYGFKYPGYPWLGPLLFIVFTFVAGVFLAWVTLRAGSVWPAVIGHAEINGLARLPLFFLTGQPNPLLGPAVNGIIGGIGFIVVGLLLFLRPQQFNIWRTAETRIPAPAVEPVNEELR